MMALLETQGDAHEVRDLLRVAAPPPLPEDSEFELVQQALDQVELADRLGYDYAWEVEHPDEVPASTGA